MNTQPGPSLISNWATDGVRMIPFGFATRLAAFYAAIFVLTGVQLPFFPVWLKAKGLDAGMIGIVLAMPMVVRVLAIPFAAREADRRDALRAAIMALSVASVAGFVLLGLSAGVVAIFVANIAVSLCFTPIMPLAEAYALKGLAARGRACFASRPNLIQLWPTKMSPTPPAWKKSCRCANAAASFSKPGNSTAA